MLSHANAQKARIDASLSSSSLLVRLNNIGCAAIVGPEVAIGFASLAGRLGFCFGAFLE